MLVPESGSLYTGKTVEDDAQVVTYKNIRSTPSFLKSAPASMPYRWYPQVLH